MALPITIPNTFATATNNIPLSQIDANFTTVSTAINGIGNGSEALANVTINGGRIANVTATNVTANVVSISNVAITGGTITGITDLAVLDGGTGGSNAATARTNLGAAASGANSDITSLTGLTTPLSVAQGGTGAATLTSNNVLLGNGTSAPQTVAPSTSGNLLTSNGTTWASAAPPAAIGVGQTWQTVTGSRSAGTTYQNTTGKPIMVSVSRNGGDNGSSFIYVDTATPAAFVVAQTFQIGAGITSQLSAIVPPNNYYRYTGDSIVLWTELR
jgi:hypothetical protein